MLICKGTRNDKDLLTVKFGSTHLRDPQSRWEETVSDPFNNC